MSTKAQPQRYYITEVELRIIRELVRGDEPIPAGLVGYLLLDRDMWVDRAVKKPGQEKLQDVWPSDESHSVIRSPMRRERLFDDEKKDRRVGTTEALVALDPAVCPACGASLTSRVVHQPALLRHGGYGATRRVTTVHCDAEDCQWHMEREVTEVNPRG